MKIISASFFAIAAFLIAVTPAYALGISPTEFNLKDVLPDSQIPLEVTISRPRSEGQYEVTLDVTGSVAPLLSLPATDSLVFKDGEKRLLVPFILDTKGITSGSFEGVMAAHVGAKGDQASGSPTELRVTAIVRVEITNEEKVSWAVSNSDVRWDAEKGQLALNYIIDNTGNVPVRPSAVRLHLLDYKTKQVDLGTLELSPAAEKTPPYSRQNYEVYSAQSIEPADYYYTVEYLDDQGTVVHTQGPSLFQGIVALPESTFQKVLKDPRLPLAAVVIVFGVLAVATFLKKKKKRSLFGRR